MENKYWELILIGIIILIFVGLVIWQIPYTVKENYTEKEPNTITKFYTVGTSKEGCLKYPSCYCVSSGVYDISQCSYCTCEVEETKTVWETIEKTRNITKYCSALNRLFRNC